MRTLRSLALATTLTASLFVVTPPTPGDAATGVVRHRIGTSVLGRALFAYELGDPDARLNAVVVGQMHGNEPAGFTVAKGILERDGVRDIHLWVVPTLNPDGRALHTRQNAHGVDLNRNWAHHWIKQTGDYASGPRPFSEPETRAVRDFLDRIDPRFIVSLHQPLHGVDSDHPKNRPLMNRLATNLGLLKKPFTCGSGCHGTMTGWFNAHHGGSCITVEFGPHPLERYLRGRASIGVVRSEFGRVVGRGKDQLPARRLDSPVRKGLPLNRNNVAYRDNSGEIDKRMARSD